MVTPDLPDPREVVIAWGKKNDLREVSQVDANHREDADRVFREALESWFAAKSRVLQGDKTAERALEHFETKAGKYFPAILAVLVSEGRFKSFDVQGPSGGILQLPDFALTKGRSAHFFHLGRVKAARAVINQIREAVMAEVEDELLKIAPEGVPMREMEKSFQKAKVREFCYCVPRSLVAAEFAVLAELREEDELDLGGPLMDFIHHASKC